ncbi:MAG: SAM-dependent methyltransferase [Ectothiorhodospiraceae bacterium]|nr:SAM-dependent methyltransferase [Ectothiorhodospiraceae bacterium]MCH8504200.1 SAM-dependent methyltransferase [Ectothiorhodospiraceae bacterium]
MNEAIWQLPDAWPQPDPDALAASKELAERLCRRIEERGGWLSFADWMEAVLYEPGLGYYTGGGAKFGTAGDFVTAPVVSPLFAWSLAGDCRRVLEAGGDSILEFGPGDGSLCLELLAELERQGSLPDRYLLLERSASLRQRQREMLSRLSDRARRCVAWVEQPPQALKGVILANEVADALPVRRFRRVTEGALELGVEYEPTEGFRWGSRATPTADRLVAALERDLGRSLEPGYESELHEQLPAWVATMADTLAQGLCLIIDYGYPRREYYHPQRYQGTVMCHYRHRAHGNPLVLPGLQDVTAFVDFTAMALAAVDSGLDVLGYTPQAQYLMGSGVTGVLEQRMAEADTATQLRLSQQAKTLMLPGEMGERFQVLGLGRHCSVMPSGFSTYNRLERL